MAPVGEKVSEQARPEDDGQNLWLSILSEVSTRSSSKLPSGKTMLVLGEDGSGKTSLIAKLQGADDAKKGRGLEYLYLNVHDEDRDDHARCNVWVLDGDPYHRGLLKFALTAKNAADTLALLVADLSRPWQAMEALHRWSGVLREHLNNLGLSPEQLHGMEHKLVRDFQSYLEPSEAGTRSGVLGKASGTASAVSGVVDVAADDDGDMLPLGETTLSYNLGLPIVVVCTKSDAVALLEKEHDYREEHFDFIQSQIRQFCLRYGAALIYTSLKEGKNVELLYKYLVHQLYGFPFQTPAHVVDRDAVFIPAGWDNEKKIGILHENFSSVRSEDRFEDIIVKPSIRKYVQEKEVLAEDEQMFLMKQQALMSKQPPVTMGRSTDMSPRTPGGSPRAVARPSHPNVASVSPIPVAGGATSEGVLANFFNSLLNKKPGTPVPATTSGGFPGSIPKQGSKSSLTDFQAELDRMARRADGTCVSPEVLAAPTVDSEPS
uniref:cytoplasmic dynein 1 light intermediate chain 1 isoform X3 n=1 Tax=Myxine glutinosa TaxID=7769 RepID=UPI00358F9386